MYRVLEGLLEEKFTGEARRAPSVVMDYALLPESEPVRQKLNICREVRNLLTHAADESGAPLSGSEDAPSFASEYRFKLSMIYDGFHTREGAEMARPRARAAREFYESLLDEARGGVSLADRLRGVLT